jgi:DNA helicase-2/ATP-dependent DNA helicase PcrA|tara:strand:+ start:943 stop:2433 length:1491 start_codon:yes stop_codon:yes gene_type:complete
MKTIVLGPPGTGKTETLLGKVEDHLKKTDPNKIGFFAFTQKAAYEARDRAMEKFDYTEDDLPYFRTLHSLAFRRLGIKKENVMQKSHYQDFGKKIDFDVDYLEYDDEEGGIFTTKSDYLRIIQLAKLRNISIAQQYDLQEHTQDVAFDKLKIIANELTSYKKQYGLIDFNDMILDFIKSDSSPKFDVVFIDEAQDLSLMQWDMARSIWNKTDDSYIAGDDDQAIFRWAGADVDSFIAQDGKFIRLMQSHRIPKKVHDIAMSIVNRISHRLSKEWKPKTVQGSLTRYSNFENVDMSSGEWLVLARTRFMLNELEDVLYQKGLYYKNKFKKSYEEDLYTAIVNWEQWRKDSLMNPDQIKQIYNYMSPEHADRNQLLLMNKDAHYSLNDCKEKFGLRIDSVWYESLNQAPWRKVEYIRKMRSNGEQLNKTPRILLSTIHGVKGGEAQNVVLLTDLSLNTQKGYERNPDDENRLFYVGATRTKEHLHIIEPKDVFKSYPI